MSSLPAMDSVATDLYERLAPLASLDEENGYAFAALCGAIGAMYQRVADLSEDRAGRPGWAVLVDVETAPADALAWLGQIVGVSPTVGASEDVQRSEVRLKAGQARGRPASTIAKTKATLTGANPTVRLIERTGGSAWQYIVLTRTAETPDPAATLAAILSDKPGGDLASRIVSDDPIWAEATLTWAGVPGVAWEDLTVADVT